MTTDELLQRWSDGSITANELRELTAKLAVPEHQSALVNDWLLESSLPDRLPGASVVSLTEVLHTTRLLRTTEQPQTRKWPGWFSLRPLTAAAVLVIVAVVGGMMVGPEGGSARPLAVLTGANEAVWADANVEAALRGGELPSAALRLEAGTAEFMCMDGATVVLRGPASVRFVSRKMLRVESGRVFCRCPVPESRLTVETPSTQVVDLGTEFAVEAREDGSTMVAVLSGEVQVGGSHQQRLRKGETVEVRSNGIVHLKPLAREDFAALLRAAPSGTADLRRGGNLLGDAGFEGGLQDGGWTGTQHHVEPTQRGGRRGAGVRIASTGGFALWPQCQQRVRTGDIGGKVVIASVWAASDPADALRAGQFAILKVAFLDERGREFAFAKRHLLLASAPARGFERAELAAFAPEGTREVVLQLVLSSRGVSPGAVIFDDASFMLADPPDDF